MPMEASGEFTLALRVLSGLVAAGLVLAAWLGPLLRGVIVFHVSADADAQYRGGEIVSLIVAVVLAYLAVDGGRVPRMSLVTAIGLAAYVVYTFVTVVMGQEYARYPGNAEKAFPLYAALTAGALALAVLAYQQLAGAGSVQVTSGLATASRWVLIVFAGLIALLWAGQIYQVLTGSRSAAYEADQALFWLIKFLDFGFVLPAMVAVGLATSTRPGVPLAAMVVAFACCLTAAITAMAISQIAAGNADVSWVMVAVLTAILGGLGWLLARWYAVLA